MPKPSQVWFPTGEELGADAVSGRGGYTRRYLSINYSPPGASDEPALNIEHTPASALAVPGLKVFAGPFSVGDAILIEKVVQTGNFLAGEYQGADIFSIAGDGDTWTDGTIEAEKANAGGVVAAVDGTTALDLTTGNVFTCTPAENTSWSTTAPTNGIGGQRVSFVVDNSGGFTVAWAVGFTNIDSIGATDTGISVRTLQFDGTTWHQIAATLDGVAIISSQWSVTEIFLGDGDTTITLPATDDVITHLILHSFKELTSAGSIDNGGTYYDVVGSGGFVFTATSTGVRAYSYNGVAFTLIDTFAVGCYSLYHDGSFLYVAAGGDGIYVLSFDGSNFTEEDHEDDGGIYYCVDGDGTTIFVACYTAGICAYTCAAGTLTNVGDIDDTTNPHSIACDGTHVYTLSESSPAGLSAYTFAGGVFTNVGSYAIGGAAFFVVARRLQCRDGYIFVTYSFWPNGFYGIFQFAAPTFTLIYSSYDATYTDNCLYSNGAGYVFFGAGSMDYTSGRMFANTWDGATLDAIDSVSGQSHCAIWDDGTYVFSAIGTKGVVAYTFAGANVIATITNGVPGQLLTTEFTDAGVTITDDDDHAANTVDLAGTATDLVSADDKLLQLSFNNISWYQTAPVSIN